MKTKQQRFTGFLATLFFAATLAGCAATASVGASDSSEMVAYSHDIHFF